MIVVERKLRLDLSINAFSVVEEVTVARDGKEVYRRLDNWPDAMEAAIAHSERLDGLRWRWGVASA